MQKKLKLNKLIKIISLNQNQNQMNLISQKILSRSKKSPSKLVRELSVLQPIKKAKKLRRKT